MSMRNCSPALMASQIGALEHFNLSSLGVLSRYGQYADFRVQENYTAAHASFLGMKVNVCTSGSSGALTACVMTTRNVVPDARELAKSVRDDLVHVLTHLPTLDGVPMAVASENGHTDVREDFARTGALMQPLIEERRDFRAARRQADGTLHLGDASGRHASWALTLRVMVAFVCAVVATGPISGFPLYARRLEQAGLLNHLCEEGELTCEAQSVALQGLYNSCNGVLMFSSLPAGYVYDIWGAKVCGIAGGLVTAAALMLLVPVVLLDSRAWPATQTGLLYALFILAELAGGQASMAVVGFMWHLPGQQAVILGMNGAATQAGAALGLLFEYLGERGFEFTESLTLIATMIVFATAGMLVVPPREEVLAEAGHVLGRHPGGLDASSVVGYWHLKGALRNCRGILNLYPQVNYAYLWMNALLFASVLRTMGKMHTTYDAWFNDADTVSLMGIFAATFGVFGLCMNPFAGVLIEKVGFVESFAISVSLAVVYTATIAVPDVTTQTIAIVALAAWLSTYLTVNLKYAVRFAPPALFGTFQGGIMTFAGFLCILLNLVCDLGAQPELETQPELAVLPSLVLALAGTACALRVLYCLRRDGLPMLPPRDRYDAPDVDAGIE
jgi:MFS family permease